MAQLYPNSPAYNEPILIRFHEAVDVTALSAAINEIIIRHEAWRTTFFAEEGQVYQQIQPPFSLPIQIVDVSDLSGEEREAEALRHAVADARQPFDLAAGPLVRATLIQVDKTDHRLCVTAHHIVVDGLSFFHVFLPELHALYNAFRSHLPSPLPEPPIQFADFADWQREQLTETWEAPHLSFWKSQLEGSPSLDLPTDFPRPALMSQEGARQPIEIPAQLSEALVRLSRRFEVSLFTVILAAWKTLLYRYTGQSDVIVGAAVSGRPQPELEGLIGFFSDNLVLRTKLDVSLPFTDLLQRTYQTLQTARAHQAIPFERLVSQLKVPRTLNENPLYQNSCVLMPPSPSPTSAPYWTVSRFDIGTAKLDLYLELHRRASGLFGHIEYRTDLFRPATVAKMVEHLKTLLGEIIRDPEQPLCQLRILTAAEVQELADFQGDTAPEAPGDLPPLPQLFEEQVERTPDADAVLFQDERLTYRQLNCRANQLAHHLRSLGVRPDVVVGLYLERSLEMIVAILGVLKAGGAYLPLDPSYPPERLRYMKTDADLQFLITQGSLRESVPQPINQIIDLHQDGPAIAQKSEANPQPSATPTNLAYVLYTSGSTGLPKAVLIEHRGYSNLARAQKHLYGLKPGDRVLQLASFSFDLSASDLGMTLTNGATLVVAPTWEGLPGPSLVRLLRERAISVLPVPPSTLQVLPMEDFPALRTIMVGGEACSADLVARWAKNRRFLNAYGPTECTVMATIARCHDPTETPPIGRPLPNVQVYVLDEALQQVPCGVPGELYIGGHGVARGYLNRPQLTAERFIANPLPHTRSSRLYRTGDRVRWKADGNLEFLGRIDRQVKLRGFRIELGEIEACLQRHPAVREARVVWRTDSATDKRLLAYFVPIENAADETLQTLNPWLKDQLPAHMVPAWMIRLDRMPLTPVGKINESELPSPSAAPQLGIPYVAPHSEIERAVVAAWQAVLQHEPIGVRDNFFDLGGHSLRLVEVQSRLQASLKRSIPMLELLRNPTVRELAIYLSSPTAPAQSATPASSSAGQAARETGNRIQDSNRRALSQRSAFARHRHKNRQGTA